MAASRLDFRILGPLEVRADGERVRVGGGRQRALLALLLLNANRVVSRDRLLDGLLDEPRDVDRALRVQMSRLRVALGRDATRIVSRPPGYVLRVEPGELDLHAAETLLEEGRRALRDGDAAAAAERLREAESLWRGPPLEGANLPPSARGEVERLEELRLVTVEERLDVELALGRHAALLPDLERLVAAHPLRERLRAQQMLALYRCGRQADALESYRRLRALLVDELGLEPGPPMKALEQAILRHEEALVLETPTPEPPGESPRVRRGRPQALPLALLGVAVAGAVGVVLALGGGGRGQTVVQGDAVVLVSARSGHPEDTIPLRTSPTRLAAGFGSLWVSSSDASTISRVDLGRGSVRQTIQVGGGPFGVAIGGGAVWVANTLDGTVSRVDPATETVVDTIQVGQQPSGIVATHGAVWVANRGDGTVSRIDPDRDRVTAVVRTGRGPSDLAAADGTLWVANEDDGTVTRIDAGSGAVVETVDVGDAPSAIAATSGAVWVLDRLDSTLSRIDPARDVVVETVAVGSTPQSVAAAGRSVWVSDGQTGDVLRVEPGRGVVSHALLVGERVAGVGVTGGRVWVGVAAGGRRHRGGTLTALDASAFIHSIDPAVGDDLAPTALLGLVHDGLVTLNHVSGPDGAQLVPDLALALPRPTDGGRTYTFRLRPGIRYSSGAPVTANDVRHSLERLFDLHSSGRSFYDAIVGTTACKRGRRCDLSRGIVVDDHLGTVTFHLSAPDPDFLYKLATPFAYVIPAATPAHEARTPLPATGPYLIRSYQPGKEVRLIRNPHFHEWSSAAQPNGYPDVIVWLTKADPVRAARLVVAGRADLVTYMGPPGLMRSLRLRSPGRLRGHTSMSTSFYFLNVHARPFDDVRVRRAFNYAIDRRHDADLVGGSDIAAPTCQVLPPQMPGFRRYCPYTREPSAGGAWRGPDLKRARALVAESGTKGMTVGVWNTAEPTGGLPESRYLAAVLRRLGYRASLHLLPTPAFFRFTSDSRNRAQVVSGGWGADYPAPSAFIGKLSCAAFAPNSTSTFDDSEFCEPAIDRQIAQAEALQASQPAASLALWARLDRELTNRAIWLPTLTIKSTDVISPRVGNYQFNPFWGALIDQIWVR